MKFEVLQENLREGLASTLRSISSRPQLPVLSNVLLDCRRDGLYVAGTDLELGVLVKVGAKVEERGRVTVPARIFSEFVLSLPAGKIIISLKKEILVVKSGSFKSEFQTISAEEYPSLPEFASASKGFKVKRQAFAEAMSKVVYSSAKDSMRPVLTGVLFSFGKSTLEIVATDGFRLATQKIRKASGELPKENIVVPSRALAEVLKVSSGDEVSIAILRESNQVVFAQGDTLLVSQLLDGNFPDYTKIIPKDYSTEILVSKDELMQSVSTGLVFARDNSNVLQWKIVESELEISSESPQQGSSSSRIEVEQSGDDNDIAFNGKFLVDFLQTVKEERVWLGMSEKLSPGSFRGEGDKDFLYVVMPINL